MRFEDKPLVAIIEELRELGRQRRLTDPDDAVVALARRAHAVLMWFELDEAGQFEAAETWLARSRP
jgi:hypothetical protein